MSDVSICVCQNDDCNKPYVVEESIDFLQTIDIGEDVKDWAQDRVLKYCVDCCMEMLTALHDIFFIKSLDVKVEENISACSREEYEQYLKDKHSD